MTLADTSHSLFVASSYTPGLATCHCREFTDMPRYRLVANQERTITRRFCFGGAFLKPCKIQRTITYISCGDVKAACRKTRCPSASLTSGGRYGVLLLGFKFRAKRVLDFLLFKKDFLWATPKPFPDFEWPEAPCNPDPCPFSEPKNSETRASISYFGNRGELSFSATWTTIENCF